VEELEIARDGGADAGALHLHDDLLDSPSGVASTARCTWPIDAVASGFSSKLTKTSRGRAQARLDHLLDLGEGTGGTSSWSFFSSAMSSGGRTSLRVLAICPSLMKLGPRSWSTRRARSADRDALLLVLALARLLGGDLRRVRTGTLFLVRPNPRAVTISPKPWRTRTPTRSRVKPAEVADRGED
jgi:hypothetical protein